MEIWKIFASLGVPGVALGVLYFLFRKFNWNFPRVPKVYVGPIVILFMLLVTGIVFYALTLWAPDNRNKENGYAYPDSTATSFPYFMTRPVTGNDLKGKSDWELDIMRNEIFARHGRRFKRSDLQNHFYKQKWYVPKFAPEDFPHLLLTELQRRNAAFILDYQQRH